MAGKGISIPRRWLWAAAALLVLLVLVRHLPPAAGACSGDFTPIYQVTGDEPGEALDPGTSVRVKGAVTGVFLDDGGLDGFFIQGEGPGDGLPSGVFVYASGLAPEEMARIRAGRQLALRARTGRWQGQIQLQRVRALNDCGEAAALAPQPLRFPLHRPERRWAGLWVRVETPMTVSGSHELQRYGSLHLAADGRAFRPSNFLDPDERPPGRLRLILDDGSHSVWPEPVPWLDERGTRRVGTRVEGLEGILADTFGALRLHPTRTPRFVDQNPRPAPPERAGEGLIRVAGFNVENYFLTLGERGADSARALDRQRARLLPALAALDADIVGLVEMENDRAALEDLVAALNDHLGADRYRAAPGTPDTGSDAIKVSLIYRPDRVERVGGPLRDLDPVHHRPPIKAAFRPAAGGAPFAVAVVHHKAKVGCPDSGDIDRGQGCWNLRRQAQSEALLEAIGRWREDRADDLPVLIVGDVNAYGGEDPVRALLAGGKRDLLARHLPPERRYTYVFRGESGYLDHALAPPRLADRVQAAGTWAINADEPRLLEYDARGIERRFRPGPWRSSDHDPVWVDLRP
ncbi:ExeM/NucH family extracellular endonuclease [Alkalilimnicola ehrlichii]|uniref:ExeM/NucH family extracellular endonuclease n=1 Tax=Alkalilimnicola ehrlichii TaxID=351052 RepID=UPI003BA3ADB7